MRILGKFYCALSQVLSAHPVLYRYLNVIALVGTYILLDWGLVRYTHLSPDSYARPYLIVALVENMGAIKLGLFSVIVLLLLKYANVLAKWESFEHGQALRWFILFLALLMAWPFTFYGYNYYFDQGHYLDRILVAVFLALLWFRPVVLFPFLLLIYTLMFQLTEPALGGPILAHKLQVLHVLNLFGAFFLLFSVFGVRRIEGFVFVTCCLVAGAYWEAALAKIEIDWVSHGHLYRALLSAYAHGWLAFLSPDKIVDLAHKVAVFDLPMRIYVFLIETAFVLFFLHRLVSFFLLATIIVFHVGVFALYGFLFWTWILLDLALLWFLIYYLKARTKLEAGDLYARSNFLLSLILIGFVAHWASPPHLGWFDTRLSYTFQYTVVGISGKEYPLSPRFFQPYGDTFTMASFTYLVKDHGILVGPYGITKDISSANKMQDVNTIPGILALEAEMGPSRYDPVRSARFYEFIGRYLRNWNDKGPQAKVWSKLAPPPQFWSSVNGEVYNGQERIRDLIIRERTTFYDDNKLIVIRDNKLATVGVLDDTE